MNTTFEVIIYARKESEECEEICKEKRLRVLLMFTCPIKVRQLLIWTWISCITGFQDETESVMEGEKLY